MQCIIDDIIHGTFLIYEWPSALIKAFSEHFNITLVFA